MKEHNKVTGFSGNDIFCLNKLGYKAGQVCLGNNVLSLGVLRGIKAGLSNLVGGEIEQVTKLVHDGRKNAYNRMVDEAGRNGGVGLADISFNLISIPNTGVLEFVSLGSTIHQADKNPQKVTFSTSDNAQELYCQIDAGFTPHGFVFGNVAYSIGVGGNIAGALRGLKRGEVPQYTKIFDQTRHLALTRIKEEAKLLKANSVIGIKTSIVPLLGTQEMMMLGTASSHTALNNYFDDPVTSDMTNQELWNLVSLGYLPIQLVLGVSVYSLGLASGIASYFKSLLGGEVENLTELLYEAREKAFERAQEDAQKCNADEVVGIKTYVYDLGGGLVEFMVIGTAIKKIDGVSTQNDTLPVQATIQDKETFVNTINDIIHLNQERMASARSTQRGPITIIFMILVIAFYLIQFFILAKH
jgi:uncharacterized protein YbjQ (UPF0145 family)